MNDFGNIPDTLIPYLKDYTDIGLIIYSENYNERDLKHKDEILKWDNYPLPIECICPYIEYHRIQNYTESYIAFITSDPKLPYLWIKIRGRICTICISTKELFDICKPISIAYPSYTNKL